MTTFGSLIRSYRLRAGLGLRTFAALIDERASIVSAIESGRRAPWRREAMLSRVAEVLGLVESSNLWGKILALARGGGRVEGKSTRVNFRTESPPAEAELAGGESECGRICGWWCAEEVGALDMETLGELSRFVGASFDVGVDVEATAGGEVADVSATKPLTELAIEWRVRQLLGRRETQLSASPVDVEAALENEASVRIEIIPGLIPRFSVQACVVKTPAGFTFFVDRIFADSRPIASYRHLLALCFAPLAIWNSPTAQEFQQLRNSSAWSQRFRDCQRFALALLLPANPILAAAETAYSELIQQQGYVELDIATRTLRNRLAEQFAVPTALVDRRLVGWPCHLYGRIAQALAAEEPTLPPTDWVVDDTPVHQRLLFELKS